MQLMNPDIMHQVDREAERLCEVLNELDRLERGSGRPVSAEDVATALGWSGADLVHEALVIAVELGCAVGDGRTGYRLG